MANYKISDTTLTSIGDAIRRKVGDTKIITVTETVNVPTIKVIKCSETSTIDNCGVAGVAVKDCEIIDFTGATSIQAYFTVNAMGGELCFYKGRQTLDTINSEDKLFSTSKGTKLKHTFPYDVITVVYEIVNPYQGYYIELTGLDENGNPIGGDIEVTKEVEVLNTMTPAQMAQAIDDIPPAPTDEELTITGDCTYRFAYNGWNWIINKYVDKIKTRDITTSTDMFYQTGVLEEIPFELNMKKISAGNGLGYLFAYCSKLKSIPKINNAMAGDMANIFISCQSLRTLPEDLEDWFDWSYVDTLTSSYSCSRNNTFNGCYSLRKVPMGFLKHGNPVGSYSNSIYYNGFYNCYALDEIVGLPFPHHNATWTSTAFYNTFNNCKRLKNMTFAVQEDGTPYSMKWKSQTIDLSTIGYAGWNSSTKPVSSWAESERKSAASNIIDYNSGITFDKCIYNDGTYALLKDDEDAFCIANYRTGYTDYSYSRYNHDSAVNTINSLPDTSAYLATAGGTNTIKFQGASGSKTDGGAINTLTEEEIAVAAAKGWTVTLV